MRHLQRRGRHWRVADPSWRDPLSPTHAQRQGGRWNLPGAFGVTYLNASRAVARAQVRHKLEPRGIYPEDLDPAQGPNLVHTEIPDDRYVDAVTKPGLTSLGLPGGYRLDGSGRVVPHETCQPIGLQAHKAGETGIACLSAAEAAPPGGEELAYFGGQRLRVKKTERFAEWFWADS